MTNYTIKKMGSEYCVFGASAHFFGSIVKVDGKWMANLPGSPCYMIGPFRTRKDAAETLVLCVRISPIDKRVATVRVCRPCNVAHSWSMAALTMDHGCSEVVTGSTVAECDQCGRTMETWSCDWQ